MPECRRHDDEMLVPLRELQHQYAILGCNSAFADVKPNTLCIDHMWLILFRKIVAVNRDSRNAQTAVLFVLQQVSYALITFLCKALLNSTIVSLVLTIMFEAIAFSHVNSRRGTDS